MEEISKVNFFKNFFRQNFCSQAKKILLETFDLSPYAETVIVLLQASLLGGELLIIEWVQMADKTVVRQRKRNLMNKTEMQLKLQDEPYGLFDQLLQRLNHEVESGLHNYSGSVKDGVAYSLAWGRPSMVKEISIRNPQKGERHHILIQALLDSA